MKRLQTFIIGCGLMMVIFTTVIGSHPSTRAQQPCTQGTWQINDVCQTIDNLALNSGWNTVIPAGDTLCALGSPYQFWVRPGSEKLLFYFQDGGTCRDYASCQLESGQYKSAIEPDEVAQYQAGIFDFANPANPFSDYSVIFVPACTGDLFMGNQVTTYQDDLVIHHSGYINLLAVLDFAKAYIKSPASIFVMGSGAGSIGSIIAATTISEKTYPGHNVQQISDSYGLGLLEPTDLQTAWGASASLSDRLPEISASSFALPAYYELASPTFSRILFTQLNAGQSVDNDLLARTMAEIALAAPGFRYMLLDSDQQNFLISDTFYTAGVDGVLVRDWVAGLTAPHAVENVPADQATLNRQFADAINSGDLAVVHEMLANGANPNIAIADSSAQFGLVLAVSNDDTEIALALLEAGADISLQNRSGYNAFQLAADSGNLTLVEQMLPYVTDINLLSDSEYGPGALHLAASNGYTEVVRLLVENGADVNVGDKYGDPPLNWAVYYGQKEMVLLLIEYGADVNAQSKAGNTPLSTARRQGYPEIQQILLDAGATPK